MDDNEDSWLPDEADAIDLESLPAPKPNYRKSAVQDDSTSSSYDSYGSDAPTGGFKANSKFAKSYSNKPKYATPDDTPRYSFGSSTGSSSNDEGKKKYPEKKYPQKKQWKKPEPRDFDENPVDEEERVRLLKRAEMTAVWHLARRDMTYKQVEEKLKKKGVFPPDVIQEMMDKCVAQRWVDDERYAESFVRSRSEDRKLGKNAIRMELIKKGVDRDLIDNALEEVNTDDEYQHALELVEKQLPRTQNLEKQKRVARLLGLLARKGYSSSVAYAVIREAIDAEIIDDDLS